MTSHIPNHREQMVLYFSYYSNVWRGLRQKESEDALTPCVIEVGENAKHNRNWARLFNNDSVFLLHILYGNR